MERPPYGAASPLAYAQQQRQAATIQQQQQYGFHPQHQQFPPSVHGPPFLPSHPAQFPFHPHMQQQPQLLPHHPQHAPMLHQQPPPAFASHLPPHLGPSPFHGPYNSPPPPAAAAPSDPELQKRIDKLVEYIIKNGPEFEAMIREKQQDNPDYSFLFGGEGHAYYRYKLWLSAHSSSVPYGAPFPPSSMGQILPPPNPMMGASPLNAPALHAMGAPHIHQPPFPPFYDQQHHLQHSSAFLGHGRADYDPSFKGLSGPLPSDVASELSNVLNSLSGTKDSIKSAKVWFMQRSPFAPALAEALKERIFQLDDSERQLHIIYLTNDILFDSLQRRINPHELDNEAFAFRPVLGSMLARIYHNPQNKDENQSRLQKIIQFWASKEVYDQDTIYSLESEMLNGPPPNSFPVPSKDLSAAAADSMLPAGVVPQPTSHIGHWQHEKQVDSEHQETKAAHAMVPLMPNQPFVPNAIPVGAFPGSVQTASQPPAAVEKLPPYPLFPPGLIPGMVRKTQIGSGVPYSPLSPLDIPTSIPPSDIPPSEILERVSKFFREIGEVNPSEGPMNSESRDEDYEYKRESPIRKGGACIPPPPNLQVDPDTGTYPDGSVERKPGSGGSGRLGLGATANPNEVSQYDDVYTSYRKQRSTSYHSSMSARATTR